MTEILKGKVCDGVDCNYCSNEEYDIEIFHKDDVADAVEALKKRIINKLGDKKSGFHKHMTGDDFVLLMNLIDKVFADVVKETK